ncbi:10-formyltetrahydrofolate:L-methionyl-tRNA(fMet) N-formyltransferase [Magnetospirillum gryphiswaldense MSR-1 v2]|uniref:Methionyl-tRNA formyltransferase n=1 Tax=Magnetospirillum gryphiswaldense (strain DSM 6361 / JCM 21280 / NBRC 15271 / MSR-1) TaxID=431944 RepID=V6F3X7_MAGGM|nr:methionyl-tRNA formyltransferase [Magnetospirillum gryphiswaldense]CDL00097.1 10-formyltetrahydrofolate:L-methionyl-tRNA(fMet) N-formyltransferase [Magnetospirillum gryphiswaldense MSR-1 v2]
MRLAFMGTPDFSVAILSALLDAGHDVVCVYAQPPRPAGRGHKEQLTPVHAFAAQHGIEVRIPKSLKSEAEQQAFRALDLDAAVVAAYGLILPQAILDAPRRGCLNVHASLLPRWRGAAPIQRAILAGDAETGVTIMQMDAGLDTGAMLLVESLPITADTNAASLHDALAVLGARLIVDALARYDDLPQVKQPEEGVTYAHKLAKDEGRLDWNRPAVELERQVRGLTPWPGVWCQVGEERLKVLAAGLAEGSGAPGTVLDDSLLVACGSGALRLLRVQRAGKGPMEAADLLRGFAIPRGSILA